MGTNLHLRILVHSNYFLRHTAPEMVGLEKETSEVHHIQRKHQNANDIHRSGDSATRRDGMMSDEDVRLSVESEVQLQFTGHRPTVIGEWCYLLCCLTSLHWVAIFVLLLLDTYSGCQIGGIDNLCIFGNHFIFGTYELNGKVFFTVWWLAAIWYTTWVINKGRVHNWFRMPCELNRASVVDVWMKDEQQILSVSVFPIVLFLRVLKKKIIPPETRGHFDCIPIECTKAGQRFILYQGQRFNICGDSIDHAEFQVGLTLAHFYQGVEGLSKHEAEERIELVGLNEIPFNPEPVMSIIFDELFTVFHVYQLLMYILQFWNSYLFVAALMTCIVSISATITIVTRRRSQIAIAKHVDVKETGTSQITEYVTEAVVLRKGKWTCVDSRKLAPGDVLKVKGAWKIPCDLLILQGVETSKGELISNILYPEKMIFKYDEELPVVVTLLVIYGVVCFALSLYFQTRTGAQSYWVTKWIYCMAILSQILSPLLPVALEIGQLQGRGIFCLNPKRIAISGKIRVFCFDKTGTLTRQGLDFIGVQSAVDTDGHCRSLGSLQSLEKDSALDVLVVKGLATCHAVTRFGDLFVGNQVEVKMFSSIGGRIIESPDKLPSVSRPDGSDMLTIVKRNEFDHARATMSVIVEDSNQRYYIYCKGSFERIHELSSSESLPDDYMEIAQGTPLEDVLALSRDEVEADLEFVTLILFRNEMKPESCRVINDLKQGEVRPLMITGDNAHCGHYIAMECGMVAAHVSVMLGDVREDGSVGWSYLNSQESSSVFSTEDLFKTHIKGLEGGRLELAVTGKAFGVLQTTNVMEKLLLFTRIYARFKPADKVKVVDMHKALGLIVGMCGDGGNDCGALRGAHAGIALSEAEASVVSPFTSKTKSVLSVVDLLREGRSALHTSFACYKYLITYGLMFSVLKLCCCWYGIILCQMDYLFIDGVAVLSLGYAMTLSYPEEQLGKTRPTSSLIGALNTGSIVGVWVINIMFTVAALIFMANEAGYVEWPAKFSQGADWWTLGDNWDSTVLFFMMYFQYITSAFVFSFGSSFRRNVFSNLFLMVTYWGLIIFMSVLLLLPHSAFTELWHVSSEQFQLTKYRLSSVEHVSGKCGSTVTGYVIQFPIPLMVADTGKPLHDHWQKVIAEGSVAQYLARKRPSIRPKFHLRKCKEAKDIET